MKIIVNNDLNDTRIDVCCIIVILTREIDAIELMPYIIY